MRRSPWNRRRTVPIIRAFCCVFVNSSASIGNAATWSAASGFGSELLFEVFSQRYERGSKIVTTNLPFDEWTSIFGSERLTGALLDRLTHHVHILEMNGESYRLTTSKKAQRRSAQERSQIPKPPIEEILPPKHESTWKHKNKSGLQSPFLLTRLGTLLRCPLTQFVSAIDSKTTRARSMAQQPLDPSD
jgi:IstB-like ATP binding protein